MEEAYERMLDGVPDEVAKVVEGGWYEETARYALEERDMDLLRRIAATAEGRALMRSLAGEAG